MLATAILFRNILQSGLLIDLNGPVLKRVFLVKNSDIENLKKG